MTSRRDFLKGFLSVIGGVAVIVPNIDFTKENVSEETEEPTQDTRKEPDVQGDLMTWKHVGFYGGSSCSYQYSPGSIVVTPNHTGELK